MRPKGTPNKATVADEQLFQALADLSSYEKEQPVNEAKIQSARTRLIFLKQLASEKRADKIEKLKAELKERDAVIAELNAKVAAIPPDAVEKIGTLEAENSDLRQQLLVKPSEVEVVKTVTDPVVIAERDALKQAVAHLAEGLSNDRKTEIIVEQFEKSRAVAQSLFECFRIRFVTWDNIVALMKKSDSELLGFQSAYKSPLAAVALTIRAHRVQSDARAKKEKNDMRLAVEATPIPPSPEELSAREAMEKQYTPEAIAARVRAVEDAAKNARKPLPPPTSPKVAAINAEIEFEQNFEKQKLEMHEKIERMRAEVKGEDIT